MASILTYADRYKWTIWELWDWLPKPPREPAAELGTELALPDLRLAVASKDTAALQPNSGAGGCGGV